MTHGIAQIVYGQCRYNKHTLSSGAKSLTNRGDSSMASPAILLLGEREREMGRYEGTQNTQHFRAGFRQRKRGRERERERVRGMIDQVLERENEAKGQSTMCLIYRQITP